jgi:hypothetical protein
MIYKTEFKYRNDCVWQFILHNTDPDNQYPIEIINHHDTHTVMHLTKDQLKELSDELLKELAR